jgi:hypothetical protein
MKVTKQYPVGATLYDEWWDDVLRAENPAPVNQAFDWLRERVGTDDTGALKRLLYRAAGERTGRLGFDLGCHGWPEPELIGIGGTWTGAACRALADGEFVGALDEIDRILNDGRCNEYQGYRDFARAVRTVVDLCRELEALP